MMKKTGFSLIELLVVVTIIAILSAVGIAAFRNVSSDARDAKRKADVDAIVKAYETKYDADRGIYPVLTDSAFTSGSKPTPPEGGSYTLPSTEVESFQICTPLDDAPDSTTCTGTSDVCYCRQSSQGKYTVAESPDAGGDGAGDVPAPPPDPVLYTKPAGQITNWGNGDYLDSFTRLQSVTIYRGSHMLSGALQLCNQGNNQVIATYQDTGSGNPVFANLNINSAAEYKLFWCQGTGPAGTVGQPCGQGLTCTSPGTPYSYSKIDIYGNK